MKAKAYKTIVAGDAFKLDEQVSEAIKSGWQPLGGVSVSVSEAMRRDGYSETSETWAQAMIQADDS